MKKAILGAFACILWAAQESYKGSSICQIAVTYRSVAGLTCCRLLLLLATGNVHGCYETLSCN